MPDEPTEPPVSTETAAPGRVDFDAALSAIDFHDDAAPPSNDAPPATEPGKQSPPPAEPAKAAEPAPKPGSFKALKQEKEREKEEAVAAVRAEYEAKIAELSGKVVDVSAVEKPWQDKLAAAEALRAEHATRLAALEKQVIEDYETPYSIEVDPDAQPVLATLSRAQATLDAAVNQAATSLGDDQRSVTVIAGNRQLFAELMAAMSTGLTPDAVHADNLVAGLQKLGVTVPREEARAAVRDLKSVVPKLMEYADASRTLAGIKARNAPLWSQKQAARHEAYRLKVRGAAEVAEDAAEGDDAVIAGILKARPELREKLTAESERISSLVVGPMPGKATAAAVRATPMQLHENAVRAARLPVVVEAYRSLQADLATKQARIAELEARIGTESGAVPKPAGGAGAAAAGPDKRSFDQKLQAIFPGR